MASEEIHRIVRVGQWRQLHFSSDLCAWSLSALMPVFIRTLPVLIQGVESTTFECLLCLQILSEAPHARTVSLFPSSRVFIPLG